eukprot:3839052-Rhodomonas_salina.3
MRLLGQSCASSLCLAPFRSTQRLFAQSSNSLLKRAPLRARACASSLSLASRNSARVCSTSSARMLTWSGQDPAGKGGGQQAAGRLRDAMRKS